MNPGELKGGCFQWQRQFRLFLLNAFSVWTHKFQCSHKVVSENVNGVSKCSAVEWTGWAVSRASVQWSDQSSCLLTRPTPISRVQDKNNWTDLTPYCIFLSKIRLKPDPNQTQTRLKPDSNQTQTRTKPDLNQTKTRPKPNQNQTKTRPKSDLNQT